MARIKLAPPWVIYYNKVEELFKEDPGVRVLYDEEDYTIKLYVEDSAKANALTTLLPGKQTFGNIEQKIEVIPANSVPVNAPRNIYGAAFDGNKALSYIQEVDGIFKNKITYVVFKNKVVQYYSDDLSDVNGLTSTLYQEIAKEVFGHKDGVFFCTDVPAPESRKTTSFGKPLGEWP